MEKGDNYITHIPITSVEESFQNFPKFSVSSFSSQLLPHQRKNRKNFSKIYLKYLMFPQFHKNIPRIFWKCIQNFFEINSVVIHNFSKFYSSYSL